MSDDEKKKPRQVSAAYGYRNKPDGSIDFDPDVPAEVREEIVQMHLDGLDYEAKRRELWGEIGPSAMTRLAKLFPSLRDAPGVEPWDAIKFLDWLCSGAATSGNTAAGLFVLGVWNDEDWTKIAHDQLPERQCNGCYGLGVVDREDGEPVKKRSPERYVRTRYDDDDNPRDVEVQTKRCEHCNGKGTYKPAPAYGRFNLFGALGLWDAPHRAAVETWVRFPFWP